VKGSEWKWIGSVVVLLIGLCQFVVAFYQVGLGAEAAGSLGTLGLGLGPFFASIDASLGVLTLGRVTDGLRHSLHRNALDVLLPGLLRGAFFWVWGWTGLLVAMANEPDAAQPPSIAAGKPLHSRLAKYRDFHWGTLAAYGFGILLAEVGFLWLYLALVGKGAADGAISDGGLPPVWAFVWAFLSATLIAFASGFVGAANSRRHSTPEATLAILYFGLGLPALLSAMHQVPRLAESLGYRLREITYLASLLGDTRPELGYWLVTAQLALGLVLGINAGFVATSSGRLDLRASYELFIASRHVSVFRPTLLLGVFGVLICGVIPPLVIAAMVRAAEAVAERTRIRRLGEKDPLLAAEALNALKMSAQTPTAMMTSLAVGGVGVGVMALIIVLSVMSGFEADLQKKILGTNSHGVVLKHSGEMPEYLEVMQKIRGISGLTGMTPFILNEVMVSSDGNTSGAMIKGVDPRTVGSVTDLPEYILPGGALEWLEHPEKIAATRLAGLGEAVADRAPATGGEGATAQPPRVAASDVEGDPLVETLVDKAAAPVVLPGIIIGREQAASLRVRVGDRLNIVSPLGGELGPQGPMPKSRPFRVAGIFYSGMYEYDSKFIYIHLREAESFFGVKGAMGLEVRVADVDEARSIMTTISKRLDGYPYRTKDWGEMNRNLFSARRWRGEDLPRRGPSDWRRRGASWSGCRPRVVLVHREGGHQARRAGVLHPLAPGAHRALPDDAGGRHRRARHLPCEHLPRAQGRAGRAGRRPQVGVSVEPALPRSGRRLQIVLPQREAHRRVAGRERHHRAGRTRLARRRFGLGKKHFPPRGRHAGRAGHGAAALRGALGLRPQRRRGRRVPKPLDRLRLPVALPAP
jgi:lipoprotein-releasing system permease protein